MSTGPFETNAIGVNPGDVQQVVYQWDKEVVLRDFTPDAGLTLTRVVAGRQNIVPDEKGVFTWGQKVPAKAYVTALVRNDTKALIIGKGQWFVEGHGLQAPEKTAQTMSGAIPPKEAPALRQGTRGMPNRKGQPITSYPVGRNELAIAMTFGEAKRLQDAIAGGMPIISAERPAFLRRFNHAFAIFQGQDVPQQEQPVGPAVGSEELLSLTKERDDLKRENERLARLVRTLDDVTIFKMGYEKAVNDMIKHVEERNEDPEVFRTGYETAVKNMVTFASMKANSAYDEVMREVAEHAEHAEHEEHAKHVVTVTPNEGTNP